MAMMDIRVVWLVLCDGIADRFIYLKITTSLLKNKGKFRERKTRTTDAKHFLCF